jgi:hypothetical protein
MIIKIVFKFLISEGCERGILVKFMWQASNVFRFDGEGQPESKRPGLD